MLRLFPARFLLVSARILRAPVGGALRRSMSLGLHVAIPHRGRNYVDHGSGNVRMSELGVGGLADGTKL